MISFTNSGSVSVLSKNSCTCTLTHSIKSLSGSENCSTDILCFRSFLCLALDSHMQVKPSSAACFPTIAFCHLSLSFYFLCSSSSVSAATLALPSSAASFSLSSSNLLHSASAFFFLSLSPFLHLIFYILLQPAFLSISPFPHPVFYVLPHPSVFPFWFVNRVSNS